ncbi:MAG: polyprenyl synthetase family protein [Pyrinomonadaceae bacterium]
MTSALSDFIGAHQQQIESALRQNLPVSNKPGTARFNQALSYAVFPGGKRLRPIITLLAGRLVSADEQAALGCACAIEFLHTSSLILDDLPGMDDADLRRNQTAVHLVFGEGLAVLAAVALLNQAYAQFAAAARGQSAESAIENLLVEATNCVGANGMIGGQVVDLEFNATAMDPEILAHRDAKTIALMRLMMTSNALATGASSDDCAALRGFGELLGEAYQICDDLLDDLAASSLTGKTPGQDSRHWRLTAITELGHHDSYRRATSQFAKGETLLRSRFGNSFEVELLVEIGNSVIRGIEDLTELPEVSVGSSAGVP